jgi:hypothetical protein
MGNLIKLLIIGGIVIAAIALYFKYGSSPTSANRPRAGQKREGIEVQEKYGVAPLDSTLTGN